MRSRCGFAVKKPCCIQCSTSYGWHDVTEEPAHIVKEFRERFYDTELFFDKYAKGKFAQYLFDRYEKPNPQPDEDWAHRLIEEDR